jgi:nucleoside-diphosphate-sugar epimerase
MKIFLTGASGFIGSHVARLLVRRGDEVHVLLRRGSDRSRIEDIAPLLRVIEGDLTQTEALSAPLAAMRPDVALLFGWYAEPGKYLRAPENIALLHANIDLASRLARVGCRKVVAAGTCFEYDTDLGFLSESTPSRPRNLYAASKLSCYLILEQLLAGSETKLAWVRLFYQYGPHEHPARIIPSVMLSLLQGLTAKVTPGEQIRDFLHVEDVARAVVAVADSELTGPVNIGSGRPVSIREIVQRIGALTGCPDLIRLGEIPYGPGDPRFICADNRKLREGTGWCPAVGLDDGLRSTLEWWRSTLPTRRRGGNALT